MFKLWTTASYISVGSSFGTACVNYSRISFDREAPRQLFQKEATGWRNITKSYDPANKKLCGELPASMTATTPFELAVFRMPTPEVLAIITVLDEFTSEDFGAYAVGDPTSRINILGKGFNTSSQAFWNINRGAGQFDPPIALATTFRSANAVSAVVPAALMAKRQAFSPVLTVANTTPIGLAVSNRKGWGACLPQPRTLTPSSAVVGQQVTLTVEGACFARPDPAVPGSGARIRWNGLDLVTNRSPGSFLTLTFLTATIPASAPGTVSVAVNNTPLNLLDPVISDALPFTVLPATSGGITGTVSGGGFPVVGALVQACIGASTTCFTTSTNAAGNYSFANLAAGLYNLAVSPPTPVFLPGNISATVGPGFTLANFVLQTAFPPPQGSSITSRGVTANGIPVVFYLDLLTIRTIGCPGAGMGRFRIVQGPTQLRAGDMVESPPNSGIYTGSAQPLKPAHGNAVVEVTIPCVPTPALSRFDIYIDPSGTVTTTTGQPIPGATVTLLIGNPAAVFTAVPDGSLIMSPSNRRNSDMTFDDGAFGWDVLSGSYRVRASAPDCTAPDGITPYVESPTLMIPPAVVDLNLQLNCRPATTTTTLSVDTSRLLQDNLIILKATVSPRIVRGSVVTGFVDFTVTADDGTDTFMGSVPVDEATGSASFFQDFRVQPGIYQFTAAFRSTNLPNFADSMGAPVTITLGPE